MSLICVSLIAWLVLLLVVYECHVLVADGIRFRHFLSVASEGTADFFALLCSLCSDFRQYKIKNKTRHMFIFSNLEKKS